MYTWGSYTFHFGIRHNSPSKFTKSQFYEYSVKFVPVTGIEQGEKKANQNIFSFTPFAD